MRMSITSVSRLVSQVRVAVRPRSRVQATANAVRSLVPRGRRATETIGWDNLVVDNASLGAGPVRELMDAHRGAMLHKWRHYPDVYEREFSPYRHGFVHPDGTTTPLRFLEIGVSEGGSQVFWRTYFGPDAIIFGVDIDRTCADRVPPEVAAIRIGSQADPQFLRSVVAEMGGVDLVLDDGSHVASHQRASFDTLWPLLSDGGLYVIEDTHTAYWKSDEGGLRRSGTAIEDAKDIVDDMHRWYYREAGTTRPFVPDRPEVQYVSFYDSVIAIGKRSRSAPARFTRGEVTRSGGSDRSA